MTSSDLSSVLSSRRLGRRKSVGELREEYKSIFKEMEEDGEVSTMRTCIKCQETKRYPNATFLFLPRVRKVFN